jgi:hypothetical protein
MPSVAGVVIVNWLAEIAGSSFRKLLLLPSTTAELDGAALLLFFLYGNLFCYIASYPILCFHATRVLDFTNSKWPSFVYRDGYVGTVILSLAVLAISIFGGAYRFWAAFVLVACFSGLQVWRLWVALMSEVKMEGLSGNISPAFAFAFRLAKRRGVPEETHLTRLPDSLAEKLNDPDEEKEIEKTQIVRWRKELVETYRHLREHGNSAFIFLLELVLAALCYCVVVGEAQPATYELSVIAILLGIWSVPSIFAHLVGQQLERRFSLYDKKVEKPAARSR